MKVQVARHAGICYGVERALKLADEAAATGRPVHTLGPLIHNPQAVEALRARGVEVEYLVKDDEGHGFVRPENRMEAYGAIERFFAKHLGGRTAA